MLFGTVTLIGNVSRTKSKARADGSFTGRVGECGNEGPERSESDGLRDSVLQRKYPTYSIRN